jgi:hypothetical protein
MVAVVYLAQSLLNSAICRIIHHACLLMIGGIYNCTLAFDCSDILCGCDCPCLNDTELIAAGVKMVGLGLPSKSNATL